MVTASGYDYIMLDGSVPQAVRWAAHCMYSLVCRLHETQRPLRRRQASHLCLAAPTPFPLHLFPCSCSCCTTRCPAPFSAAGAPDIVRQVQHAGQPEGRGLPGSACAASTATAAAVAAHAFAASCNAATPIPTSPPLTHTYTHTHTLTHTRTRMPLLPRSCSPPPSSSSSPRWRAAWASTSLPPTRWSSSTPAGTPPWTCVSPSPSACFVHWTRISPCLPLPMLPPAACTRGPPMLPCCKEQRRRRCVPCPLHHRWSP